MISFVGHSKKNLKTEKIFFFLKMSSRIKKTFFFSTKEACLFYYSDLPLGYRIVKSNNSTQQLGDLVCILAQTGQVFLAKLASKPNLNISEQWNESYFRKLFDGMQNFILQQVQNDEDEDIQLQNTSQSQNIEKKPTVGSKVLLVRDPTQKQEEIYLLRCILKQSEFHKGRTGINRLWQEFQKYGKFMRRQQNAHQKHIINLQERKQQKFKQINQLLTKENKKKNILRQKLTQVWKQKVKKFEQLSIGRQHLLPSILDQFNRDEQQSSMNISEISNSDLVNSQDDRPLTGSLFQPSQSYQYRQQNKISQENYH